LWEIFDCILKNGLLMHSHFDLKRVILILEIGSLMNYSSKGSPKSSSRSSRASDDDTKPATNQPSQHEKNWWNKYNEAKTMLDLHNGKFHSMQSQSQMHGMLYCQKNYLA
jgi:hypothetical protein